MLATALLIKICTSRENLGDVNVEGGTHVLYVVIVRQRARGGGLTRSFLLNHWPSQMRQIFKHNLVFMRLSPWAQLPGILNRLAITYIYRSNVTPSRIA